MNATLLAEMLASRAEVKIDGETCAPVEDAQLALLLTSHGGPLPLAKIKSLRLGEAFVTAETADGAYLLPYSAVAGVRVESATSKHPGFRR